MAYNRSVPGKAKEHKTNCILLASHFRIRMDEGDAIDEPLVRERLGHGVSNLTLTRRQYGFTYPFPPAEVVEFFRQYYGSTNRASASLDETDARKLRDELEELWSAHNRGGDDSPWFDRSIWK